MIVFILILILIAILYSSERGRDFLFTLALILAFPFLYVLEKTTKENKKK